MQANISPLFKGEEILSANRKGDGSQIHSVSGVNGKTPNMNNKNEFIVNR